MTQGNLFLQITDGTTIIDLAGQGLSKYILIENGWTPNVPELRKSQLGGRGPYGDVVEEINVHVTGQTASEVYANLQSLAMLLEQANRWANGQNVAPVLIKYSPKGAGVSSMATPLQAIVLGRVDGDQSGILLPVKFNATGKYYLIEGLRVRFKRRGEWILSNATTNVNASGSGIDVLSGNLGLASAYSPMSITLSSLDTTGATVNADSFLVMRSNNNQCQIVNAQTLSIGAFTSFNDSINRPVGGTNVLRYTPTGTSYAETNPITLSPLVNFWNTFIVLMTVRNSSASVTFNVRAKFKSQFTQRIKTSPPISIGAEANSPISVFVCSMSGWGGELFSLSLEVQASSVSGSPTLDIDRIHIVEVSTVPTFIIGIPLFSLEGSASPQSLYFVNGVLSQVAPSFLYSKTSSLSSVENLPYKGDLYFYALPSPTAAPSTFMVNWIVTTGNYWQLVDSGGNVMSYTVNFVQHRAYRTPI